MERTGTESQGPRKTKLLCNEITSLFNKGGDLKRNGIPWQGPDDTLAVSYKQQVMGSETHILPNVNYHIQL